ncbi:MAG TPA: type II toxin-antitoxin system VapC family toxin [Caulobacteraceae bacterium]|nr:type II toxin-antitoxin system VapC family toxin [Caulobacteraceae bacterium]
MRLLLDTHVALWGVTDYERLRPETRRLLEDRENEVFVSVVTLWEIAIKHALPKGRTDDMPVSAAQALAEFLEAGFRILDVAAPHAVAVAALPSLHRDPFDRMLIAQARAEPLRLLTVDRTVAAYGAGIELA